jgi:hypothetical protein
MFLDIHGICGRLTIDLEPFLSYENLVLLIQ